MKRLVVVITLSILICVGEILVLIKLFPRTGLARMVYVPFYIIAILLVTVVVFNKTKTKGRKKQIVYWTIFYVLFFNYVVWSWPQDGRNVNVIGEFYRTLF